MHFRQCLLDECTAQLKWPQATCPKASPAAFRTLWVLLVWWRERPEELRGVYNKAFTRLFQIDASRAWHQIDATKWLEMLHEGEKDRHGYELTAEERRPQYLRALCMPEEATPFARVQLQMLYHARQLLTMQLSELDEALPERFSTAYDAEELMTLYALLQFLPDVEWMSSHSTFRILQLMETPEDRREFWIHSTRALMRGFDHASYKAPVPPAAPLNAAGAAGAAGAAFPGLFEARAYNAFRIYAGGNRLPMYARAWLQLLHFAYEATFGAPTEVAFGDGQMRLFEEVYALLGREVRVRQTWVDLSCVEDESAFWEELARYMLAVLIISQAQFQAAERKHEAWCEKDAQGMLETILAL